MATGVTLNHAVVLDNPIAFDKGFLKCGLTVLSLSTTFLTAQNKGIPNYVRIDNHFGTLLARECGWWLVKTRLSLTRS